MPQGWTDSLFILPADRAFPLCHCTQVKVESMLWRAYSRSFYKNSKKKDKQPLLWWEPRLREMKGCKGNPQQSLEQWTPTSPQQIALPLGNSFLPEVLPLHFSYVVPDWYSVIEGEILQVLGCPPTVKLFSLQQMREKGCAPSLYTLLFQCFPSCCRKDGEGALDQDSILVCWPCWRDVNSLERSRLSASNIQCLRLPWVWVKDSQSPLFHVEG